MRRAWAAPLALSSSLRVVAALSNRIHCAGSSGFAFRPTARSSTERSPSAFQADALPRARDIATQHRSYSSTLRASVMVFSFDVYLAQLVQAPAAMRCASASYPSGTRRRGLLASSATGHSRASSRTRLPCFEATAAAGARARRVRFGPANFFKRGRLEGWRLCHWPAKTGHQRLMSRLRGLERSPTLNPPTRGSAGSNPTLAHRLSRRGEPASGKFARTAIQPQPNPREHRRWPDDVLEGE